MIDRNMINKTETDICAVQHSQHSLTCWNCDEKGNSFFDCMEPRQIFCYGCGAKGVYKPTCSKCSRKSSGNGLKDVRKM